MSQTITSEGLDLREWLKTVEDFYGLSPNSCFECGGEIALCLINLGSLHCHDCRKGNH